jgi:hypothetical protein
MTQKTWTLLASVLSQMSPVHTFYHLFHFIDRDNTLPLTHGVYQLPSNFLLKLFTYFVFLPRLLHIASA